MGHHYLPQYYLRGFAPSFGRQIWAFDRQENRSFCTNVRNIANETNLYSDELERKLAEEIEGPAMRALDRVRACENLNEVDRHALSTYIVAMWKRVPKSRRRLRRFMPQVTKEVREEVHRAIDVLVQQRPDLTTAGERRKAETTEVLSRYQSDPPQSIWHYGVDPANAPRIVEAVAAMAWTFWVSDSEGAFVTCDDPVFIFEGLGIGRPDSELSFPVSGKVSFWGTWRKGRTLHYVQARNAVVRELNRRCIKNCERFVFGQSNQGWVLPLMRKQHLHLNRIG